VIYGREKTPDPAARSEDGYHGTGTPMDRSVRLDEIDGIFKVLDFRETILNFGGR
jgi:hypothetical protein